MSYFQDCVASMETSVTLGLTPKQIVTMEEKRIQRMIKQNKIDKFHITVERFAIDTFAMNHKEEMNG